ncbi:MAG TPA: J domain-containing protein [Solirubrobacteraceae bacterium]|jgi:hypothetical protein
MVDDPYSILEVSRHATDEEIERAYGRLLNLFDPEHYPGSAQDARQRLDQLNAAYAQIRGGEVTDADGTDPDATEAEDGEEIEDAEPDFSDQKESDNEPDERRSAIAHKLARLGFISEAATHGRNLAVEVLAALLPPGADIGICLTCVSVKSSGPYQCRERHGTFPGMRIDKGGVHGAGHYVQVIERSELVLCTPDELLWTVTQYGGRGDNGFEDTVTLYSIPFEDILGAEAKGHKRDVVDVWIDDGPTVSIHTPPGEAEALSEYVERAARETD